MTRASRNRSISVVITETSGYKPRSCISVSCGRYIPGVLRSLTVVFKVAILVYSSTHSSLYIIFLEIVILKVVEFFDDHIEII